jgi:hypothetical protein
LPDAGFNSPKMSLTSVDLPCPFYGNNLITWENPNKNRSYLPHL